VLCHLRFVFSYRLPDSAKQRKRSAQRSRQLSSHNDASKTSMLYNTGVVSAVLDKYAFHHTQHDIAWLDGLAKHSSDTYTAHNSSECSDSVWHDSAVYNSLRLPVTVTAAKALLHTEATSNTVQHNSNRCCAEQCVTTSDENVQLFDTIDSEQHQDDDHSLHDSEHADNKQDAVHDDNSDDGATEHAVATGALNNLDDTEAILAINDSAVDELDTDSINSVHNVGSTADDIHTVSHEVVEAGPTPNQQDDDATVSINNADSASYVGNSCSHSTCSSDSSKHVYIAATLQQLQQTANYSNTPKQYPTTTTNAAAATISQVQAAVAAGQWAMATVKSRRKERTVSVTVRNRPKSAPAARRNSTATSSSSDSANVVKRNATAGLTITTKQCTGGTQWDVKMLEVKARRELRDQQLVSYSSYTHLTCVCICVVAL
jgi:hypothetical protein